MPVVTDHTELNVYNTAMRAAVSVYRISGQLPDDEKRILGSQMRRAAGSVCANIAEGWRKRRYKAAFISKLSDAEAEAAEVRVWLELACRIGHLPADVFKTVDDHYRKVLGQLVRMMAAADQFGNIKAAPPAVAPARPHAPTPKRPHDMIAQQDPTDHL